MAESASSASVAAAATAGAAPASGKSRRDASRSQATPVLPHTHERTNALSLSTPLFSIALRASPHTDADELDTLIVAGGGGSAKTGVPNTLAVLTARREETNASHAVTVRLVASHDTEFLPYNVALAPDGRFLAAVAGSCLDLYQVYAGSEPHILHKTRVNVLGSAPSSSAAADSGAHASVAAEVQCSAWAPCKTLLAAGGDDGRLYIVRAASTASDATAPSTRPPGIAQATSPARRPPLELLPAERAGVVCSFDAHVAAKDAGSRRAPDSVEFITFSASGSFCGTCGADGSAVLWEMPWLSRTQGTDDASTSLAVPPNVLGSTLPPVGLRIVGHNGAPRARKGLRKGQPDAGTWRYKQLAFLNDEGTKVVALESSFLGAAMLSFWSREDAATSEKSTDFVSQPRDVPVRAHALGRSSTKSSSASGGKWVCYQRICASAVPVTCMRLRCVLFSSAVALHVHTPSEHSCSPGGSHIVTGDRDGGVSLFAIGPRAHRVWNAPNVHNDVVTSVSFLPRSNGVASVSADKRIVVLPLSGPPASRWRAVGRALLLILLLLAAAALFVWLATAPASSLPAPLDSASRTLQDMVPPEVRERLASVVTEMRQYIPKLP